MGARIPGEFRRVNVNSRHHRDLSAAVQRFRGSVYLEDGAVQEHELTPDGRHQLPIDRDSWHVVTVDGNGEVCACLRFLEESSATSFDRLWIRNAAVTRSSQWGFAIRQAVEKEIRFARTHGLRFGEVGGWAIAAERRGTIEALRTILATYGLLQLLGGSVGIATATSRHGSAPILRRIGLSGLGVDGNEVPPYFDPQYGCEMELLRFDSRFPNPKYAGWVKELGTFLLGAEVVCAGVSAEFDTPMPVWAEQMPLAACL